jgi:hypothetical protein
MGMHHYAQQNFFLCEWYWGSALRALNTSTATEPHPTTVTFFSSILRTIFDCRKFINRAGVVAQRESTCLACAIPSPANENKTKQNKKPHSTAIQKFSFFIFLICELLFHLIFILFSYFLNSFFC